MAPQPTPSLPQLAPDPSDRKSRLHARRERYTYMPRDENRLWPICVPGKIPFWQVIRPAWSLPFLPGYVRAYTSRAASWTRYSFQKLLFRFEQMEAYEQLFWGDVPEYVKRCNEDEVFGYRRIAGPNALSLVRVTDLACLLRKIPFDVPQVEARLGRKLRRSVSLANEVEAGRLFEVDFKLIADALRPEDRTRDSRWRRKYTAAPIGVFLEEPDFFDDGDLVPLAIQVDPLQPDRRADRNPIYYPDDEWGWQIAKLYFEVADENWHVGVGHVYRTHLLMDSFALATERQLSEAHPIHMLLQPHIRFTLGTNKEAYKNYIKRSKVYFKVYAGTLEELRLISKLGRERQSLSNLALDSDIAQRGVEQTPADYPYRDDAQLWSEPIRTFVSEYVDLFYESDLAVVDDSELQAWAEELTNEDMGGLPKLSDNDVLDSKAKLVDVLALAIFVAGPGHASQHFSQMYYYRHAPSFAASAYSPPPWKRERRHRARYLNTLPPIGRANLRFTFSQFGNFKFDDFGDYSRYPLGRIEKAAAPIRKLQAALQDVEEKIRQREEKRFLPYGFLRPSRVPNSINI